MSRSCKEAHQGVWCAVVCCSYCNIVAGREVCWSWAQFGIVTTYKSRQTVEEWILLREVLLRESRVDHVGCCDA